jgi:hypothetical protein
MRSGYKLTIAAGALVLVAVCCISMAPAAANQTQPRLGLAELNAACTGPQLAGPASCGMALETSSRKGHKRVVRFGRVNDSDNVYGDGVFNPATGEAFCKGNEQVVTGGKQIISTAGLFGGPARTADGESAPDLRKPGRGWKVGFGSDLGGLARKDFRVIVVCDR